ncbi:S41 family peptidase [Phaeacidiphilus oryzae]|uniref:S41 family peptidase n=1 Tax=Phaeacidiphilus oryzae TaxID=348818 RepID=UPI000564DD8B|nr:S41 family peptidase [Phaeacidiphilus oryzae]
MTGYLRHPDVHGTGPAGPLAAFTAEDDIWLTPLDGGRAWRFTADRVPVRNPRFSPDGRHLAWTSGKDGASEVYTAPVEGGTAVRLTHWGSQRTRVLGWTTSPEGAPEVLVFSTGGQATSRRTWAFAVPLDGGEPRRLPYGPVGGLAFEPGVGPEGRVLLLSAPMGLEAAYWKRYRGGTAGKLWMGRTGGEFTRLRPGPADAETAFDGNLECPLWVGERIAFLSDHDGLGRLWSALPDGSDLRAHPSGEFWARNAATDGTRVIWHAGGDLWLLDDLTDGQREPRRLETALGGPATARQPHPVDAGRNLGGFAPDRTGRGSAVAVRGTVHWLPHRDGPARALGVEPGVRARLPRVVPAAAAAADAAGAGRAAGKSPRPRQGGQSVLWVSDASGEDGLELAPADGRGPSRRIGDGRLGRVLDLAVSPDGRLAAAASHDGRLHLVELESGEIRELTHCQHGDVDGLVFSPDSRWLAWSQPGPEPLRQLMLARTGGGEGEDGPAGPVEATPLRFCDTSPAFTADGKHLAFLSVRTFDPVYDAHVFDVSFPTGCRPYLITLADTTPSPFGPRPAGRGFGEDPDDPDDTEDTDTADEAADDADGTAKPAASEGGSGDAEGGEGGAAAGASRAGSERRPPETVVDLEGIADRIVPFPVAGGRFGELRAAKGGVLWTRIPLTGVLGDDLAAPDEDGPRPVLERFDLSSLEEEELVDGLDDFEVSGDGSRVVLRDRGRLRVVPADRKPSRGSGNGRGGSDDDLDVDLDRLRVVVDPAAEWRQMYAETGRIMRDNFWRADLGGVDWQAQLDRYRPLLDRVASRDELADLLYELHGELGTSHAYVSPLGRAVSEARRHGLLGADLVRETAPAGAEAGAEPGAAVWRVARVLRGESSDPRARSPLAAPGAAVRAGDAILAVNGRPVDPVRGPLPLLAGTAGRPVALTVATGDQPPRETVVVPVDDEEPLRYHDWVADRRAAVHELSGGRLGYLHVPDMMGPGWAQLHRDLRVEMAREGVVVDLRENRGGHLSQLVVEKLNRRVVGWDTIRDQSAAQRYPADAPRGPVVALADEFSGSDGDIVNAAIQALGIGKVVGTRTWGGVIGIDSRYRLVDGTLITQPKYAFWLEGYGWGLENHGVDPDVEVVMAPHHWARGEDPQLAEGVRIALAALAERPAAQPPRLPPLPSR